MKLARIQHCKSWMEPPGWQSSSSIHVITIPWSCSPALRCHFYCVDDNHKKLFSYEHYLQLWLLPYKYNEAAFKLCFAFTTTENIIRQRAPWQVYPYSRLTNEGVDFKVSRKSDPGEMYSINIIPVYHYIHDISFPAREMLFWVTALLNAFSVVQSCTVLHMLHNHKWTLKYLYNTVLNTD